MILRDFIKELRRAGVALSLEEGKLKCVLPPKGILKDLRDRLVKNKEEIKSYIRDIPENLECSNEITKISRLTNKFALSHAQKKLWLIDRVGSGSAQYNTYATFKLTGSLDIGALKKSFNEIIGRHESLRTIFDELKGEPVQSVLPYSDAIDKCYFSFISRDKLDGGMSSIESRIKKEVTSPFDLRKDLMLRITLLEEDNYSFFLIFVVHHIASDGWSLALLTRELEFFYRKNLTQSNESLPELPIQYVDFSNWQHESTQVDKYRAQFRYWEDRLKGSPSAHNLPLDRPRFNDLSTEGGKVKISISHALSTKIGSLASQQGTTLFMFLQTAFFILISKWSNEEDIVIGVPVAGRDYKETESLIGFFVNTLAMRLLVNPNTSFLEILSKNKDQILSDFSNKDIPLEYLINNLKINRSRNINPLFQILFAYQNNKKAIPKLTNVGLEYLEFDGLLSRFDLELHVNESESAFNLTWYYSSSLFDRKSIEILSDAFQLLLEIICQSPEKKIKDISLVSRNAAFELKASGDGDRVHFSENSVYDLLKYQFNNSANEIAIRFNGHEIEYRKLDCYVNAWQLS